MMNLLDPREEEFLQQKLPSATYRIILRKRISASQVYLKNLSANCRLLVSAGHLLLSTATGSEAADTRKLVQSAMVLRMAVLRSQTMLAVRYVFPGAQVELPAVLRDYQAIADLIRGATFKHLELAMSSGPSSSVH